MSTLLSTDITVDLSSGARVLSGVRIDLAAGEILGVIGRSGSGKSTLAMSLLGLLDRRRAAVTGYIKLDGTDILQLSERQMRGIRGRKIGLVLQAASSALNPHMRLADQIREAWRAHATGDWNAAKAAVLETLRRLDLDCDEQFLRRFPGEISVGQAQRVLIAMSVVHQPAILIADEPTSALDPIAASEVTALLRRLNREMGMAIVYISHDLASVARFAGRLVILEGGKVIEQGDTSSVFTAPQTGYMQRLVAALDSQHAGSAPQYGPDLTQTLTQ